MKKIMLIATIVIFCQLLAGCNTIGGTLIGGAIGGQRGARTGAIVGGIADIMSMSQQAYRNERYNNYYQDYRERPIYQYITPTYPGYYPSYQSSTIIIINEDSHKKHKGNRCPIGGKKCKSNKKKRLAKLVPSMKRAGHFLFTNFLY